MPSEVFAVSFPGGEDRPPLEMSVRTVAGGWTAAPYVSLEAGNQLELTEDELRWLVNDAGPDALERLADLRDGGRPHTRGLLSPAPTPPTDVSSPDIGGSSVAGQGGLDPLPEPAVPSSEEV